MKSIEKMKIATHNWFCEQLISMLECDINNEYWNKGIRIKVEVINANWYKSFDIFIDDKDELDEYGCYNDICEILHVHSEDLLWVYKHYDKVLASIRKRVILYLNHKTAK